MDEFDRYRAAMNEKLLGSDHLGIKRFFALDTQAYQDGTGTDVAQVLDVPGQIRALTSDDIQQAARRYLDTSRYVKVVLMPQK